VTDTDGVVVSDTVTKLYGCRGPAVTALDAVTPAFGRGSFTAVMGPSGSGKSTLLHCAAGLDRSASGSVTLDGDGSGWHVRAVAGAAAPGADRFVFQSFNLPPELSAAAAAVRLGRPALGGPERVPGQALPRRRHRPGHPPRSRTTTPLTPSQGGRAPRTLACPLASPGPVTAHSNRCETASHYRRCDPVTHSQHVQGADAGQRDPPHGESGTGGNSE
jgi:energy-coupling factor transporter ATP-binding protein EcfA2